MKIRTPRITPNLWFNQQAEEAARYYVSIFPESTIGRITRYGEGADESHGLPEDTVLTVEFELDGQAFVALNGGPQFQFTEAVSFIVHCETQEEIDYYWAKLTEGGDEKAQVCGWLKDKYGVSWQVIPAALTGMICDPDPEKAGRVMNAIRQTKAKIDLKTLLDAFEG